MRLIFLLSDLREALLLRLLKYASGVIDPDEVRMLARGSLGLNPAIKDWQPDRIGYFIEPRRFNDDKDGRFWCLLDKGEASQLYQEWVEDPRYTERVQPEIRNPQGQNYFKNQVDLFRNNMESRTW